VQRAALDQPCRSANQLAMLNGDLLVVAGGHGRLETPEVRLDLDV
jgi:hypothetical protein